MQGLQEAEINGRMDSVLPDAEQLTQLPAAVREMTRVQQELKESLEGMRSVLNTSEQAHPDSDSHVMACLRGTIYSMHLYAVVCVSCSSLCQAVPSAGNRVS